ncbi:MAG: OmpH family outer membrane protein [Bacteroidia bacterium]
MKNISLVLNAILIVAVAFLYYKVYLHKSETEQVTPDMLVLPEATIVYLNSDSLLDNYPYFIRLKNSLENKQDSIEIILKGRGRTLENEIKQYQETGAGMTEQQRQTTEESLGRKQQEFMKYKEDMTDELAQEEGKLNDSLHHHLTDVLKKFNRNKNYQFILGFQKGGGILLANDSLNITSLVLEELNKKENE